jgi:hypothetical protein
MAGEKKPRRTFHTRDHAGDGLKREARAEAANRLHKLGNFQKVERRGGGRLFSAKCAYCSETAYVDVKRGEYFGSACAVICSALRDKQVVDQ